MEPGPLPPHERVWRHPSEVAAEEHARLRDEPATAISRWFAICSGTVGLAAIALLVLVVTPRAADAPVAISATTTPSGSGSPLERAAAVIGLRSADRPLATPVGDGRFAVASASADHVELGASVEVRLPSGSSRSGEVTALDGATALIELDVAEPGRLLADELPHLDDVVTVLAQPPVTVVMADLPDLEVEDGTAVLDGEGRLVGLCVQGSDGVELARVSDELAAATSGG